MKEPDASAFEAFVASVEPRLRRALFAARGVDWGREATAEALAWAWENWPKVRGMESPVPYLVRVGLSKTRKRRARPVFVRTDWHEPVVEPELGNALRSLSENQRIAVVLVHGFGWTMREVAELRRTRITTVQTHLDRGMNKLRAAMEVVVHA